VKRPPQFNEAHFQQCYAALHRAILGAGGTSEDGMGMVGLNEAMSAIAALTAAIAVQFAPITNRREAKLFAKDHANVVEMCIAIHHQSGEKRPFSHTAVLMDLEKRH